MSIRSRIFLACIIAAGLPLLVFTVGARREVAHRISAQYETRVRSAVEVIRDDLARTAADLDGRLGALAAALADDAAMRAALMQEPGERTVQDYAAHAMPLAGLDYLLLVDADGRVLSSGHFRNDYGRTATGLLDTGGWPGPVVIHARRPDGPFLTLSRIHRFTIGGRAFLLTGGIEVDDAFVRRLARDDDGVLTATLSYPGGEVASIDGAADSAVDAARDLGREGAARDGDAFVEQISTPFIDDAATPATAASHAPRATAVWTISHSAAPLHAVRRGMDTWLFAAIAAAIVLALIIAGIVSTRANRPLEELAARARRIDLERLDTSFATRRYDEVGSLSRVLDGMVQRLRTSAAELRSAERRATVGDIARQVNHDIRNGLLPIRNVIRHLDEVAQDAPAELSHVFAERSPTLRSGIGYLESLATHYARLSPPATRIAVDANEVVRAVGAGAEHVTLQLGSQPLVVSVDPVALRRVIENLVVNGVDSLGNGPGTVIVRAAAESGDDGRSVVITVSDTGSGIAPDELERIFDDFHTTKAHGTGLGLSIVRRLVADMGGRIRVDSEPGRGTTFRIELPEAG